MEYVLINIFAKAFINPVPLDDILLQFTLMHTHALQSSTGLLFHGYDYSKVAVWANPTTGASPEVWDRALGWWSMALVDILDYFPKSHPGYSTILGYYKQLAPALKNAVDPSTGAWWLVMSKPGKKGNYIESSAGAMFVYALLKGVRLGYIDNATYKTTAVTAYKYLTSAFTVVETDGTLGWLGTVQVSESRLRLLDIGTDTIVDVGR